MLPDRSEAATSLPNAVVIGLVHTIHSSSAMSTTPVHHRSTDHVAKGLTSAEAVVEKAHKTRLPHGGMDVVGGRVPSIACDPVFGRCLARLIGTRGRRSLRAAIRLR